MDFLSNLFGGINFYFIPAALICITVHECAHGLVAYKLGDPTAKMSGRLSLNPVRHIDVIGLIMLILLGFGWAKPVPVDMRYFSNPKKGMAITALAGPVSNFLLAFLALFLMEGIFSFALFNEATVVIYRLLLYTAVVSIGLGFFNLIPISPLDGSKMLLALFPDRIYYNVLRFEKYGMLLLVLILYSGVLDTALVGARATILEWIWSAAAAPFELISELI